MTFEQIMAFPICGLALVITGFMVFMLLKFPDQLNQIERSGAGLVGGSSFLVIPQVVDFSHLGTPFDLWPSVVLRIGIIFMAAGWVWRKNKHRLANAEMIERAADNLRARGIDPDKFRKRK